MIKLAALFANICFNTNKNLDALVKLRSLTLQLDRLTNTGLDILACQNLTETARSLSNVRDGLSAVGPLLSKSMAATMTSQAGVDNCDVGGEHLTVEYVMDEDRSPTSHLDTVPMSKAESLGLINLNTFLLTENHNKEEKEHLVRDVLAVGVGNLLARERPEEAWMLRKHLPRRHKHS